MTRAVIPLSVFVVAAIVCGACDSAPPPSPFPIASCDATLWYKPASDLSHVEVVTSWENWQTGLHVLAAEDGGWRATRITPPPGEQQYAFVDDGVWVADPYVGTTAFHDGVEVSLIFERDCTMPSLAITSPTTLQLTSASDGAPLDRASVVVTGDVTPSITTDDVNGITLSFGDVSPGKHVVSVTASDVRGRTTSPARVTMWNEARAWDWNDAVIYQVVVDRYRSTQGALAAPNPVSAFAGGTVAGLTQSLDAIASRGFNALWVSPLYEIHKARSSEPTGARTARITGTGRRLRARSIRASERKRTSTRSSPPRTHATCASSSTSSHTTFIKSILTSPRTAARIGSPIGKRTACAASARVIGAITCKIAGSRNISRASIGTRKTSPTRSPRTSRGGSIASTATDSASTPCR